MTVPFDLLSREVAEMRAMATNAGLDRVERWLPSDDHTLRINLGLHPTGSLVDRLLACVAPVSQATEAIYTWAGVCPDCRGTCSESCSSGVCACSRCGGSGMLR